jgi:hypothetical protein
MAECVPTVPFFLRNAKRFADSLDAVVDVCAEAVRVAIALMEVE